MASSRGLHGEKNLPRPSQFCSRLVTAYPIFLSPASTHHCEWKGAAAMWGCGQCEDVGFLIQILQEIFVVSYRQVRTIGRCGQCVRKYGTSIGQLSVIVCSYSVAYISCIIVTIASYSLFMDHWGHLVDTDWRAPSFCWWPSSNWAMRTFNIKSILLCRPCMFILSSCFPIFFSSSVHHWFYEPYILC